MGCFDFSTVTGSAVPWNRRDFNFMLILAVVVLHLNART